MFDRVTELSENLGGGSGTAEDADPGPVADLLEDGETVAHVLANGGSLEHTRDGRSTTVEPSGDDDAYVVVTDTRILFVLGDDGDEVEIEIELTDLTASHVRSGLLNSKLVVKTEEESVVFGPDRGNLEAAEDYIDRVGGCWNDMATAVERARAEMASFEKRCREGDPSRETSLNARSHLSKARHAATRDDDAPTEKINDRVDGVAVELDRRRVGAWVDRAEQSLSTVTDARDDVDSRDDADTHRWDEDTLTALVDANLAARRARETIDDVDHRADDAAEQLDELTDRIDTFAETLLADMEALIEAAREADDGHSATDHWTTAADGYRGALDADWDGIVGVSASAIEYQLAWVDAKRLHVLTTHAVDMEASGDDADDPDTAREYFEKAETSLERAVDLSEAHLQNGASRLQEDLVRVEEKKLESAGWEFGSA